MRLKRVLSRLLPPRTPATTARHALPTSRAADNGGIEKLPTGWRRLSAPSATSLPHPNARLWRNGLYKYTTGATQAKDAWRRQFGFSRYSIKAYTDFPGLENTVLPLHAVTERQETSSYGPDVQGILQFLFSISRDILQAIPGSRDVFTQIIKGNPAQGIRSRRPARKWQGKPWNLTCQLLRHGLGHGELSKPLVRLVGPNAGLRQLEGLYTPPTGFGPSRRYLQFRIEGHLLPSCLQPGSTPVDDTRARGALPQAPSVQAAIDDLHTSVLRHLMAQRGSTALSLVEQARAYLEDAIKTSEFGRFIDLSSLEVIFSNADGQRIVTSKTYPAGNHQIVANAPSERDDPSSQQMANQLDIESRYSVSEMQPLSMSASKKLGQRSIGVAWNLADGPTGTTRPAPLHEACSAIGEALSASPGSGLGCLVESMPRISDRLHLDSALGLVLHTTLTSLPIMGRSGSPTGQSLFRLRIGGPSRQTDSAITAYFTALQRKLDIRLAPTDTNTERPVCILLERFLFSANPVTAGSGDLAHDRGPSAAPDLEQETQQLWRNAVSVLNAVSHSMVFHGVDSAREMLAEALLRKIRFATPGIALERVEIQTRLSDGQVVATIVSKTRDREMPGQSHYTNPQREVNDSSTRLPETSPQNDARSIALHKRNKELRSQRLSELIGRQIGPDPPHEGPASSITQQSEQAAVAPEPANMPSSTLGQEKSAASHPRHLGTSSDGKPTNTSEDHDELHERGVADSTPNDDFHANDEPLSPPVKPPTMWRGVVIALGSNLGDRVAEIEKACRAIDEDPDMHIVDTSCLYETDPMYVEDQGRFLNGACEIETSLAPMQLLDRLQAIEQQQGRVKIIDKGPRNIDLDIAIFRGDAIQTDRLTVPHAEMSKREFVLRPLADLGEIVSMHIPISAETPQRALQLLASTNLEELHPLTPLGSKETLNASKPGRKTHVMSILNTTPDSFSDGGLNSPIDTEALKATAAQHIRSGATIIDVGGQSSRPGAPDISAEEEIARVLPAIRAIKALPEADNVAISVDTYRAAVAEAAVNAGAHIVNDISAGALDPDMLKTVARLGCTYVMMHMRGTPATMNSPDNCRYNKFTVEICTELGRQVENAIAAGIRRWRIVCDPGIGFAKDQRSNVTLLRLTSAGLKRGKLARLPTLVGPSRKAFIGNITEVKEPAERVWGTAAAVTAAIRGGADIVRVHDVKEMVQVAKMADAIYRYSPVREVKASSTNDEE